MTVQPQMPILEMLWQRMVYSFWFLFIYSHYKLFCIIPFGISGEAIQLESKNSSESGTLFSFNKVNESFKCE